MFSIQNIKKRKFLNKKNETQNFLKNTLYFLGENKTTCQIPEKVIADKINNEQLMKHKIFINFFYFFVFNFYFIFKCLQKEIRILMWKVYAHVTNGESFI